MAELAKSFDLSGKTAIITGGAGLLGRQFCATLAEARAAVLVADLRPEAAEEVADDIQSSGGKAIAIQVDVSDPESTNAMAEKAVESFGSLDILVNSAALDPKFEKDETSISQINNVMLTYPAVKFVHVSDNIPTPDVWRNNRNVERWDYAKFISLCDI